MFKVFAGFFDGAYCVGSLRASLEVRKVFQGDTAGADLQLGDALLMRGALRREVVRRLLLDLGEHSARADNKHILTRHTTSAYEHTFLTLYRVQKTVCDTM